ncbi:MAG: VWA domain-containing protein [Bacteroidales bacterium]|nr:VWA domain-containing protein [Bacteroidales bacterium]
MELVRFEQPEFLYALLVIPMFLVIYMYTNRWKRKRLQQFGDSFLVDRLVSNYSRSRIHFKFVLFVSAMVFLIFGIANPQVGSKLHEVERKGSDIMICLDVSNSMDARDIKPSRLERAQQSISRLVDDMAQDRIGIIVFAGKAYTQLPLTTDHAAAKMFLSTISTDIIPVQGTAIGEAIQLAMQSFDDSNHGKSIIVITDGENHEDDAIDAAKLAKEQGMIVHTIGMGLPEGAPIPIYKNGFEVGFKKDIGGSTVITKLNEQMLADLAEAGGGIPVVANNSNAGLNEVHQAIEKMDKADIEARLFADYEDRYQWLIGLSLLLLLLDMLLFERKSKLLQRLRLFERK